MKTKIDIEKLLQWAVRDELPKGRPVSADIGFAIGRRLRARPFSIARNLDRVADDVDTLGFVPGQPHEDAERVSDALAQLQTSVPIKDVADVSFLLGDLAGIAESVSQSLMISVFNAQAIVVACAAMGKRPTWDFECPKPYQMFAPTDGRPRAIVYGVDASGSLVEMKRNRGRARMRDGEYTLSMMPRSPIEWGDPSLLSIGESRAEWVVWHSALSDLARNLAGVLVDFEVLPPRMPLQPWDVGLSEARIITGRHLSSVDLDPRLAPKRRAAGKPVESPIEAETVTSYNRASREKMRRNAAI